MLITFEDLGKRNFLPLLLYPDFRLFPGLPGRFFFYFRGLFKDLRVNFGKSSIMTFDHLGKPDFGQIFSRISEYFQDVRDGL